MHRLHRCGCGCARTRVLECVLVQECACAYDCKCQTSTFITFTLTCVVSSHSFSHFLDWHLSRDDFSSSSGHLPFLSLFSLSPSVCLQPLYLLLSLIPSDQGYVFTFLLYRNSMNSMLGILYRDILGSDQNQLLRGHKIHSFKVVFH